MSHGIEKPIDCIFSIQNSEWHKLADVVPAIGQTEYDHLSPSIIEGPCMTEANGKTITIPGRKILIADYSACRPDLAGTENELVPLHTPKDGYRVIPNKELFGLLVDSLRDIDGATVSCVGTLEAGKKVFASVSIGDELRVNTRQGKDKILANLNFVSSHDGTLGFRVYDSTVRIVCMNTLRWSLEAQGEVGFSVYHTAGADLRMKNLPALVSAILKGRSDFVECMDELAKIDADVRALREIPLGYFLANTGKDELATRSLNASDEITRLAHKGLGNRGETLYDLANGATEYWTSGEGTGKGSTPATSRKYKAEFGTAAEHKTRFVAGLMHDETRKEWQKLGAAVNRQLVTAG